MNRLWVVLDAFLLTLAALFAAGILVLSAAQGVQ